MLDVRRLRLLRELAYRGTIAGVAQALSYTPSAVSQQLAVLEREAGVPLLARTGRTVCLTPAGRLLVGHAEAVLARLEQAAADLATSRAGPTGTLRVGVFPSAAQELLPQALATLARQHPLLEPMVDEVDPADVAELVRAGDLDAALVHAYDLVPSEPDLALATEPLLDEPMFLATLTAPGDDAGHRRSRDDADLIRATAAEPWIVGRPGTLCHTMAIRACQAAGFSPRIRHRIEDFTAVLALVAAGQGVALVPQLAAVDVPAGVSLTALAMRRRTHLAFRRGADRSPAIVATIDALRSAVARRKNSPPAADHGQDRPMRLHPNVQAVQEALDTAGATDAAGNPARIRMLTDAVHTAAAAAAALGVQVGQIANSLIFNADGRPLLVLTSGAHRADTAKLAAAVDATAVRRATADFVREHTGQPIGGVAPVGHPKPITTLVDTTLSGYPQIWAAGGVPQAVFPTTYAELTRITSANPVEVA